MNRITVNNIDYTKWADGLDDFVLSIQRNTDDGAIEYGTSFDIEASGKFYDLIYSTFFEDFCSGRKKQLDAKVFINNGSCEFVIDFLIVPDGIDICFDGCANITLQYVQPENDAYVCLKNQVSYWSTVDRETFDKDPDQGLRVDPDWYSYIRTRTHKIIYCQDWGFVTYLLYYLYLFAGIGLSVFRALCKLDIIGLADFICDRLDSFEDKIVGCDRYYTATLLKDIFEYNVNKCGLTLQSSILSDPTYKWTALESAPGGEGFKVSKCGNYETQFQGKNADVINVLQLAKKLETVFNSDFRIKGGKFYFERKDFFYDTDVILNLEDQANELEECPRYKINPDAVYAFWEMGFTLDSFDFQGNKNINQYNEIVEWNPNGNLNTKGRKQVFAEFAPSKYSHDQNIKESTEQQFLAGIRDNSNIFLDIGSCNYTHAQVVQDGQLSRPKLIIIDPNGAINCNSCRFATVQKVKLEGSKGIPPFYGYKFIYSYNDPLKGQALYDNFHYIDDPNGEGRVIKVDSVKWYPSDFCDSVATILERGLDVGIESNRYGKTIPERIEINFAECSVTFSELKFKCNA